MKKIYGIVVTILLIIAVSCKFVDRDVTSASGTAYEQKVDSVAFGYCLEQTFVPAYEQIESISIFVDTSQCAKETGRLEMRIQDQEGQEICAASVDIVSLPQLGWQDMPVNQKLETGKKYKIILESVDCIDVGPKISFYDVRLAGTKEQEGYHLVYAGMDVDNSALRIRFNYKVPIKVYEYLGYYVFILLIGLMVIDKIHLKKDI